MSHSATLLADGRVLLAGGFSTGGRDVLAEIFDPATERFTPVGAPIALQSGLHDAHRLADGGVLIFGGEYDPAAGTDSLRRTACCRRCDCPTTAS